jgi:hypothetical protein
MLTNIKIILRWIARYWYPNVPYTTSSTLIDLWISLIHRWVSENGAIATIKRVKVIRLTTTRYICGQPLMVNSDRVAVTKEGFPKSILPFKELVDSGTPDALRFTLTCLGISRSFTFKGTDDISSITKESKAIYRTIDQNFVEIFVKDFTKTFNPLVERPSFFKSFLSMKAGPQGGPSILSAQLAASRFSGVNLWGLAYIGGDSFMEWVKELKFSVKVDWDLIQSKFKGLKSADFRLGNRKFLRIHDPEAKVRIVGCYDYISQLALTPYSEWAFDTLRNEFPKDRTFTQDPVINDKLDSESYHSFDLSAATDRFPIELQVQLLAEMAGPGFANAWKNLMVAEPFVYQRWEKDSILSSMVKYKVGQPMGARSSWATFTLSHHLVVQYAAFLEGFYPFDQYILLGDDIVIYHDKVAKRYLEVINSLGVDISIAKSHESKETYEFAKRWFRNHIEISPVPINGFLANWANPKLLYSQLLELVYKNRGPKQIVDSVEIMENLISRLTKPSSRHFFDSLEEANGCLFRQPRAYSSTQVKYFRRTFEELRLVYRNMSQFDEERTRRFMAGATLANEYTLPSNPVSLVQEWTRAGSGVVNGMAMTVIKDLSNYFRKFKEVYESAVSHDSVVGSTPMGIHPLTSAIYRSVKHYHLMNKAMGYTTDLSKQLETITLLNLDSLARQDRKSEELIFMYSTFGAKLRRQLRDDPDLIIAKARTMQFGRSLMDIQLALAKEFPHLKAGCL